MCMHSMVEAWACLSDDEGLAPLSTVQREVQAGAEHVLVVLRIHAWGHNGAVVALQGVSMLQLSAI